MARHAYSGHLRAEWVGAVRRWYIFAGHDFLKAVPGTREEVVALMRQMNDLPTGSGVTTTKRPDSLTAVTHRATLADRRRAQARLRHASQVVRPVAEREMVPA